MRNSLSGAKQSRTNNAVVTVARSPEEHTRASYHLLQCCKMTQPILGPTIQTETKTVVPFLCDSSCRYTNDSCRVCTLSLNFSRLVCRCFHEMETCVHCTFRYLAGTHAHCIRLIICATQLIVRPSPVGTHVSTLVPVKFQSSAGKPAHMIAESEIYIYI